MTKSKVYSLLRESMTKLSDIQKHITEGYGNNSGYLSRRQQLAMEVAENERQRATDDNIDIDAFDDEGNELSGMERALRNRSKNLKPVGAPLKYDNVLGDYV